MKKENFKQLTREEMRNVAGGKNLYCGITCSPTVACSSSLCICIETGLSGNTPTYGCTPNVGQ